LRVVLLVEVPVFEGGFDVFHPAGGTFRAGLLAEAELHLGGLGGGSGLLGLGGKGELFLWPGIGGCFFEGFAFAEDGEGV
jgi:hypothetical protein